MGNMLLFLSPISFVHECNKNSRNDTKHDEFAWHNKILTNQASVYTLMLTKWLKRTGIFRARKVRRIGQTKPLRKEF